MKLLSRLLSSLFVLALVAGVGAWELNRTLWNANYLQQKAQETHLADGLARALPGVLLSGSGASPATLVAMQQIITPRFVQAQLDIIVPQTQQYLQGSGTAPQLNLAVVANQLQAAGFSVPPRVAQPQAVLPKSVNALLMNISQHSHQLVWLAPLVALLLAGLIFVLSGHRRWRALAGACLSAAVSVAVLAGIALVLPGVLSASLNASTAKPLEPPIHAFLNAIASDQAHAFLWVAAGLVIAAVGLILTHTVLKMAGRLHKRKD